MLKDYGLHFRLMIVTSIVCGAVISSPLGSFALWNTNIVFAQSTEICTENEPVLACLSPCDFNGDDELICDNNTFEDCSGEGNDDGTGTVTCPVDGGTSTFICDSDAFDPGEDSGSCALVSSTSGGGGTGGGTGGSGGSGNGTGGGGGGGGSGGSVGNITAIGINGDVFASGSNGSASADASNENIMSLTSSSESNNENNNNNVINIENNATSSNDD